MTIVKTTVTHQLISPSASVVQRSGIIRLGGFVGGVWRDIEGMSADGQVIAWEPANADGAGAWSVALIPNADIANPANTLYRYMPAQGQGVVFQVPQGGVTKVLKDLVVTDPAQWPSLAPTIKGDAATISVGATTTGAPGSAATVTNSGTPNAAVLDFEIPQGVKGDAATVAAGTTTTGAPGSAAAVSNSGTPNAAVFDFTVPAGAAATVAAGTTTTGAPGTSAAVSNSGTPSAAVFDFTIPHGANGVSVGDTAPTDTSLLWVDTSDPGPTVPIALDDLTDVDTAGVADKNVLTFDVATSSWKPAAPSGGGSSFELRGAGSPYGTVTPTSAGVYYTDTAATNGAIRWVSTGTTNTSWIVVVGDTGWRNITSLLPAEMTAPAGSYAYVSRTGASATLRLSGLMMAGSTSTAIPQTDGFAPMGEIRRQVTDSGNDGNYLTGYQWRIGNSWSSAAGFAALLKIAFYFAQPNPTGYSEFTYRPDPRILWPTALPGTPA